MVTLEYKIRMPLDLQMFAKEGPGGEKTEDATSKKLEDVRKEGNVAKSAEVSTAATLLALYVCLKFTIGFVGNRLHSNIFIDWLVVLFRKGLIAEVFAF